MRFVLLICSLGWNDDITEAAWTKVAEGVAASPTLTHLNLRLHSNITKAAWIKIAEAVAASQTLTKVNVEDTEIPKAQKKAIKKAAKPPKGPKRASGKGPNVSIGPRTPTRSHRTKIAIITSSLYIFNCFMNLIHLSPKICTFCLDLGHGMCVLF